MASCSAAALLELLLPSVFARTDVQTIAGIGSSTFVVAGRCVIRVLIKKLREFDELPELLERDHWTVKQEFNDCLLAWHPEATDGSSIRSRLLRLGLLTSAGLRIELELCN